MSLLLGFNEHNTAQSYVRGVIEGGSGALMFCILWRERFRGREKNMRKCGGKGGRGDGEGTGNVAQDECKGPKLSKMYLFI